MYSAKCQPCCSGLNVLEKIMSRYQVDQVLLQPGAASLGIQAGGGYLYITY